jgi:hypothetical protein
VETKAHLRFLKKIGGRCGCVYGTKGAVARKSLGTAGLDTPNTGSCQSVLFLDEEQVNMGNSENIYLEIKVIYE